MPYHFLHSPSGRSWPTDDPHRWLLVHRDDALLAPARERLVLSPDNQERCLRVALRRCSLALVHLVSDVQVVARHWGDPPPDLRAWTKGHRLGRAGVVVTLVNVKTGTAVVHRDGGDLLLHGERVGPKFPWEQYAAKFERRHDEEAGDGDAAPVSSTNFAWEGSPPERLTWRLLKSVWNAERVECPNCDVPLMLIGFEWQKGMLTFRSGITVRVCLGCHRRFGAAVEEPLAWLASVLPPRLRPTHLRLWGAIPIDWPRLSLGHARPVHVVDREVYAQAPGRVQRLLSRIADVC